MGNISPTKDQMKDLVNSDYNGPVVMLNLLKYKREDGNIDKSKESYQKYMAETSPHLEKVNGRLIYMGDALHLFIGDDSNNWDLCLLVEYPSKNAFLKMTSDPEYLKIHSLREEALEDSVLLVTIPKIKL